MSATKNSDQPPRTSSNSSSLAHWLGFSAAALKSIAWPAVALVIFFSLRASLLSVFAEIPVLLPGLQKLSIGAVSFERTLRDAGIPPEVRATLAKASKTSFALLLRAGQVPFAYLNADWEVSDSDAVAIKELRAQNLIDIQPSPPGSTYPIQYTLTPQARLAYEAIVLSLVSQVATGASAPAAK